jgi:hypothetical protein
MEKERGLRMRLGRLDEAQKRVIYKALLKGVSIEYALLVAEIYGALVKREKEACFRKTVFIDNRSKGVIDFHT